MSSPHQTHGPLVEERSLRAAMRRSYNRDELAQLCAVLGLSLENLPSSAFENQLLELIDHCRRHGRYGQLVERVRVERPHLELGS